MTKKCVLCLLLCLSLLLCGCAARVPTSGDLTTLPPAKLDVSAPNGDAGQEMTRTILLYVPDLSGARLIAQTARITYSSARHPAESALRALLSFSGSAEASPLPGFGTVSLAAESAVETAGGVATVSLSASALTLTHQELYTLSCAISTTLAQFEDVSGANILVAGAQPGLDVASTLPCGCLSSYPGEALTALWESRAVKQAGEDARFAAVAAIYLPARGGRGVVCEERNLVFPGTKQEQLVLTLLSALSASPQTLSGVPSVPALADYLTESPTVVDLSTGGRRAVLRFQAALNETLIECGITRSMMLASLTLTLTTFIPGLTGVTVEVGGERVDYIVPSGTYAGAGETIAFENGVMRRSDFTPFLLTDCKLYFVSGGKLRLSLRALPYYESRSPRYLIGQLMLGPLPTDGKSDLSPALPQGLRDADILGVGRDGDTVSVNFSDSLIELMAGMSAQEERLCVYSIVNTLTSLEGVRRARFFIFGEQPDTFAGGIYLPGDFLRDEGVLRED